MVRLLEVADEVAERVPALPLVVRLRQLRAEVRVEAARHVDADALAVIAKLAKQRKDSIDQFKKGGREDLVKEEEDELKILEVYLPKLMEKSEVETIAKAKKEELGITDATKKGMLMSALMKDLKGKADGMVVKEVVDALF